jgi:hypothetical protein
MIHKVSDMHKIYERGVNEHETAKHLSNNDG